MAILRNIIRMFGLIAGLVCLVTGCGNGSEDITSPGFVVRDGIASLTLDVVSSYADASVQSRAVLASDTVRRNLEDGSMLEAVLVDETRAVTRNVVRRELKEDAKIIVLAYEGERLYKKENATVTDGKIKIHLPEGRTYKLVFYTYNDVKKIPRYEVVSGSLVDGDETSGEGACLFGDDTVLRMVTEVWNDAMWATVDLSVTPAVKFPSVVFGHLFSAVEIEATYLTSSSDEGIGEYTAMSEPECTYEKVDVSLEDGTWSNGRGNVTHKFLFRAHSKQPITVAKSGRGIIIPTSRNFQLTFPSVVIRRITGREITFKYKDPIVFDRPLEGGKHYTVKVKIKRRRNYN